MSKTRAYSLIEALELWKEVGNKFDESPEAQVFPNVLSSLECIIQYPDTTEAQAFSAGYLKKIATRILDHDVPNNDKKTNQHYVNILRTIVDIVSRDLVANRVADRSTSALASIFDKKKKFYGDFHPGDRAGVRLDMIKRFGNTNHKGFHNLATRWLQNPLEFPSIDTLHLLLVATTEATFIAKNQDEPAREISRATMDYLLGLEDLTKYPTQCLNLVRHDLQRLCKKLEMSEFNKFWRTLILKLIQSESQEHKLLGLEEIECLIDACYVPDAYTVTGAGNELFNGRYNISPSVTTYGYVSAETVTYERTTDCGKKLILQPCLMTEPGQSHCDVWYFLSDTNGVDYYHHDHPHEQDKPPLLGWICCAMGQHPPPTLQQSSNSVSFKDDKGCLKWQVKKWIEENDVYGVLLRGCIDERHIQASTFLRKFLSRMNPPNLNREHLELSNSLNRGASVLLEPIFPLLTLTDPRITAQPRTQPYSTSSHFAAIEAGAAIEAAQQRLFCALRYMKSMEPALQSYLDASREVQAARSYLVELERSHGIIDVDFSDEDEPPPTKRPKRK